ncbi:MAG: aspartyl protease [Candidatus Aminicenantes bacterium]|nr:MAG: aspartyl protease [Candidatus Aminicenantes bacterium]
MGLTHALLKLKKSHDHKAFIEVTFIIDSGAVYSLVPAVELEKIKIKPHRTMTFVLADGTKVERKVGDAYFEWHGEGGAAPVIFGEKGDSALLGATALESLGLVLNPFTRKLSPMRMMLA